MPVQIIQGEKEWDPNRTERQCAYCSLQLTKSNRTREDYWPRWLQKKFPHQQGERFVHFTRGMARSDLEVARGMFGIRHKLPFLCKACNNEFGSLIQNDAKPAIHKALARELSTIPIDELNALAKWATMLAMTWEFADYPSKSISQTTREEFRTTGTIPQNLSIWAGRYCGVGFQLTQQHLSRWSTFWPGARAGPQNGAEGWLQWTEQLTTIGLGSIFVCVYSYEDLGWSTGALERPAPYWPIAHLDSGRLLNIMRADSDLQIKALACFSDDELQDLALGFVPRDKWASYRRKKGLDGLSIDFWRSLNTEPAWQ